MIQNRRRFLVDTVAGASLSAAGGFGSAAPTANAVQCRITDERSGLPITARVRLTDARGNDVVPLGHPSALAPDAQQGDVRFQSKRFAYVDGNFSVDPNALPLRYQIIKGYEFVIAEGEISSGFLRDGAITIPLSRWSSLAGRGWYSGDNHIHHVSPKTCRLEMDAEDLDVANILTSDFTLDQAEFEGIGSEAILLVEATVNFLRDPFLSCVAWASHVFRLTNALVSQQENHMINFKPN